MSEPAILIVRCHELALVSTVHWAGSVQDMATLLLVHYATTPRAQALSALGDLSVAGPLLKAPPGIAHSFARPAEHVCVAYGRDRGDDPATCEARLYPWRRNVANLIRDVWARECGAHTYLWNGRAWMIVNAPDDIVPLDAHLRLQYTHDLEEDVSHGLPQ